MKTRHLISYLVVIAFIAVLYGCNKNGEQSQLNIPQQKEVSSDKEIELQTKEDLLNQKQKELDEREKNLNLRDSILNVKGSQQDKNLADTTKKDGKEDKKKKNEQKEKELNKKFGNPTVAVNDYLELIQRATEGNFDDNMKKAANCWSNMSVDKMKNTYKGVKKFIVTEQPKVVSNKEDKAQVKVKVKTTRTDKDGKEKSDEVNVTYNLKADKNGNWKIASKSTK